MNHDGGQLEGAMAAHEGPEGVVESEPAQVTGDAAQGDAVEQQQEEAPEPQQHTAGEGAKTDPDIVHDVVAEHHEIGL